MKNNQKTMIVAALAVVLLGVGAFAFLPQLTAPRSPTVVAIKTAPAAGIATAQDTKIPETPGTPDDKVAKHAPIDAGASTNDLKAPVDTTKTPAGSATKPDGTKAEELSKLRDPFAKPSNVSGGSTNLGTAMQAPVDTKPVAPSQGNPAAPGAPKGGSASQPWLQPLNPAGGSLPALGSTPLPMGGGSSMPQGMAAAQSKGPRYKLKGVLQGAVSVAIFEDADGNQRMVRVGEQCDAETKVTGISHGRVTVREKGKDKTLVIEEQTG